MKQGASLVEILRVTGLQPPVAGLIPVCQLCFTHSRADSRAFSKGIINAVTTLSEGMPRLLAEVSRNERKRKDELD